jgi:hypothetical protein
MLWVTRALPREKPQTLTGFPCGEKSTGPIDENVKVGR